MGYGHLWCYFLFRLCPVILQITCSMAAWGFTFLYLWIVTYCFQVIYGTWLIEGSPRVVLFDLDSAYWKLDQWKAELWETAHIGVPYHDKESSDAVVLGFLISWFLSEVLLPSVLPHILDKLLMLHISQIEITLLLVLLTSWFLSRVLVTPFLTNVPITCLSWVS